MIDQKQHQEPTPLPAALPAGMVAFTYRRWVRGQGEWIAEPVYVDAEGVLKIERHFAEVKGERQANGTLLHLWDGTTTCVREDVAVVLRELAAARQGGQPR